MAKGTKKGTRRGPYKKKSNFNAKEAIKNIEYVKADFKEELANYDPNATVVDELAFMDMVVQQLDKMEPRQRERVFNYLYSRYSNDNRNINVVIP